MLTTIKRILAGSLGDDVTFFVYCHDFHPNIIAELHPLIYYYYCEKNRIRMTQPGERVCAEVERSRRTFGQERKTHAKFIFISFFVEFMCARFGQQQSNYVMRIFSFHILCKYTLNHCRFLFVSLWGFSFIKFAFVLRLRWNDLLIGIEIQSTNTTKCRFIAH